MLADPVEQERIEEAERVWGEWQERTCAQARKLERLVSQGIGGGVRPGEFRRRIERMRQAAGGASESP